MHYAEVALVARLITESSWSLQFSYSLELCRSFDALAKMKTCDICLIRYLAEPDTSSAENPSEITPTLIVRRKKVWSNISRLGVRKLEKLVRLRKCSIKPHYILKTPNLVQSRELHRQVALSILGGQ